MAKDITPQDSIIPIYQEKLPANFEQEKQEFQQNNIEIENKKLSALNKLKSLGLTESEAKIIIGLE